MSSCAPAAWAHVNEMSWKKKYPTAFHWSTTIKSGVGEVPEDAVFYIVFSIYTVVLSMCSQ